MPIYVTGQKVLEKEINKAINMKLYLDINNYKSGVYF